MWFFIGTSAACLTMLALLPQIIKVLKTKSVKDVSVIMLYQFGIGIALWMIYGIHLRDIIIIGANAISLASVIVSIVLYYRYRERT